MVVIDTNIVVRFLVRDDEQQAQRVRTLIEQQRTRLLLTVVLEAEWVLRSIYSLPAREVVSKLRAFSDLRLVEVEDRERLDRALTLAEGGLDFADALHVAATGSRDEFVTFDAVLARQAKRNGVAVLSI